MQYLEKMKKEGVEMCILTASEADYILPALDRLDIRKYFSHVLTCTELGEYKNDGKAYLKTMELMGGTLEETVVFEDAYYAVKGAKSVGFPVYAVLDEVVREDDIDKIKETADHYFHSYKELL
jgi:HAD superfamily hydrolase (TIGR01509 family)